MKRISLAMLAFAIGCGGEKPSQTPTNENGHSAQTTAAIPVEKPSTAEAIASIQAFLTDPAAGVGFQNVEVETVSQPLAAPKEAGDGWVYSVSLKCDNILGDKLHHKNWLLLVDRQDGKVKVKECYHNLERIKQSPLGSEWWAKSGLPEPTTFE
jgi:hypothetical protein